MSLQLAMPSTMLISGPTCSGKTTFLFRLIDNAARLFERAPEAIVYCYGSAWQDEFDRYKQMGVRFVKGVPDLRLFQNKKPALLILDDLLSQSKEKAANQAISDLFTRDAHHLGIAVIFVVQNIFEPKIRTITLNSHYLLLFTNPRDVGQMAVLARQIYGEEWRYCVEAYRDATKEPFSYLFIDLHPLQQQRYRLRTNIMPDEQTYVYLPKNLYIEGGEEFFRD